MGRKKNQIYIGYNTGSRKAKADGKQTANTKSGLTLASTIKRHSIKVAPLVSVPKSKNQTLSLKSKGARFRLVGRVQKLRSSLRCLSTVSAVLNWLATFIGYTVVHYFDTDLASTVLAKDCLKLSLIGISLVQIALVISYWRTSLVYDDALQSVLHRGLLSRKRLSSSRSELSLCVFECVLHLLTPIPNYSLEFAYMLFGKEVRMSVDDALYLISILRNYHTLRALFWISPVSELRTRIFTEVAPVSFSTGFVFRFFLAQYGLRLILGIYGVMVILPGTVQYLMEQSEDAKNYAVAWNNFWLVAYTQLTIGYGDGHPMTFPGQMAILVSCFFGVFTLGMINSIFSARCNLTLTECSMYSSLLYPREKEKYQQSAVLLIQNWWRLMHMRMKKERRAKTILEFYSALRGYRVVLVACQRVKDTMFERQIQAFEHAIRSKIIPLNEYLRPVVDAQLMVQSTIDPRRPTYPIPHQDNVLEPLQSHSPTPHARQRSAKASIRGRKQ